MATAKKKTITRRTPRTVLGHKVPATGTTKAMQAAAALAQTEKKDAMLKAKVPSRTIHRARFLAKTYAGGNLSMWLRHAVENAPRVHLVPKEQRHG